MRELRLAVLACVQLGHLGRPVLLGRPRNPALLGPALQHAHRRVERPRPPAARLASSVGRRRRRASSGRGDATRELRTTHTRATPQRRRVRHPSRDIPRRRRHGRDERGPYDTREAAQRRRRGGGRTRLLVLHPLARELGAEALHARGLTPHPVDAPPREPPPLDRLDSQERIVSVDPLRPGRVARRPAAPHALQLARGLGLAVARHPAPRRAQQDRERGRLGRLERRPLLPSC